MKKIILLMAVISLSLLTADMNGQNIKSVIRRTVVEPTRTANDIAQDKAEEKAEEEAEEHITNAIMEGFGVTENAKFDEEYKFDIWIRMQVTDYKKNESVDDQVVYDSYVNKENLDYGIEYTKDDARSTILFDSGRFALIILSEEDGEKTGFATKFNPSVTEGTANEESGTSDLDLYRTGQTKKILGYTCDEYLIDDEDSEVHMWVSEELGKEVSKEMLNNPNAFGASFQYSRSANGMTLEYDLVNKSDGKKTEMLVTGLDLDHRHSISTAGYSIVSMNLQE
jgi:hypothetical protein